MDEIVKEKDVKFSKIDKKKEKKEKATIEEMKRELEKKRKKWIKIVITSISIIIVLLLISTIFAIINVDNEKIIEGVSISGIDVSRLTKKEATEKLEAVYNDKKEKDIKLKYQDYEESLNPTLMEVNYEIEKAIDDALLIGRNGNIFTNNYEILFTLISHKKIDLNMNLNEEVTKQSIDDIGVKLPGIVEESSYSVEGDELIITKGKEGILIDGEGLLQKVKNYLNNSESKEEIIEIPVITKKPEEIDIDKIHNEIYKEVKDAYYTKEPFAVYPEVEGVDFDVEAAKEILKEEKEEYIIQLKITKPKITLAQIGEEAFHDKLSTFTTRYDPSDVDRTTNLKIACQKINGKVILSGDTFSYNSTLGARTVEAGYKNGKIYSNGQVVDGIGGGICQISSTLYNAVLMANLEIVERRNHQFVTSYLPAGRDATVVYGLTDFKFKNTRKYPVRLVASCQNGIATISVYGIKEETEYTFTFNTKTISTIPMETKYIDDATLEEGKEVVQQKGTTGLKTETYITKLLNGKVLSTTLLSRDTYSSMERIVLRGTKKGTNTQVDPQVEQQPQQEPIIEEKPIIENNNENITEMETEGN
ncbi:MAG: VanW family protein [Clostridia bacterium]|nr:VanW family protein [Clostridia bacterium]